MRMKIEIIETVRILRHDLKSRCQNMEEVGDVLVPTKQCVNQEDAVMSTVMETSNNDFNEAGAVGILSLSVHMLKSNFACSVRFP